MPEGKTTAPDVLPDAAKEIYVGAFNGAYEGTCKDREDRDACAAAIAWAAVKEKYKKEGDNWVAKSWVLPRSLVERICPDCADQMEKDGIETLEIRVIPGGMNEEAARALCDKFGEAEGFRTRCIAAMEDEDIDDPGAFCNALKGFCHGSVTAESAAAAEKSVERAEPKPEPQAIPAPRHIFDVSSRYDPFINRGHIPPGTEPTYDNPLAEGGKSTSPVINLRGASHEQEDILLARSATRPAARPAAISERDWRRLSPVERSVAGVIRLRRTSRAYTQSAKDHVEGGWHDFVVPGTVERVFQRLVKDDRLGTFLERGVLTRSIREDGTKPEHWRMAVISRVAPTTHGISAQSSEFVSIPGRERFHGPLIGD